jgi:hypothetical protein
MQLHSPLLAHLPQFELHAAPFAAKIDSHDAVVILTSRVCCLREDILDASIVVGRVELAEGRDRLADHGFDLFIIADVAADRDGLVALGGQFIRRGTNRLLVPVGERDGRPRLGESIRRREAEPRRRAGHQRDLSFE